MRRIILALVLSVAFPLIACGQQTAEQELSLEMTPALLVVMTSALPGGQMGVPYSTTLTAMGGTPPYTWAIILGALPAGLTLGATDGVLGGTATETGSFIFTVEATDSAGTAAIRKFEFGKKLEERKKEKVG